jgi:uncharacterized coiled-coil protein SlyX
MQITPRPGENEYAFTVRAHRELMPQVQDFHRRNQMVWNSWDQSSGPSRARQIASQKFPTDRYEFSPAHCHFAEHDKVEPSGNVKRVGVNDLIQILQENNSQILDRENFQAITLGHTSDHYAAKDPDVIGFAGPYRLGMIGHEKPVFAIFGDEYHRRDRINDIQSAPRRSIELNTLRSTGQRWFDPIAALGAKAPRLAMPAKYDSSTEAEVERYSVVAPAYSPGGSNTHVPGNNQVEKAVYGDSVPPQTQQEDTMGPNNISDQDIAAIVAAIEQMPEIQFIRSMPQFLTQGAGMGGNQDPMAGPGGALGAAPPAGGGDSVLAAPPAAGPGAAGGLGAPDAGDPGLGGQDEENYEALPEPGDEEDDEENMNQPYSAQRHVNVDRYQARIGQLETTVAQQMKTINKMTAVMQAEHRNAADVRRRAQLETLSNRYSIIDCDEELEKCLYSAGSAMTDKDFDKHLASLEKFGARAEALGGARIPQGELPMTEKDTERFAAECQAAQDIFNEKVNQGDWIDWDTALGMARQRKS